MLFIKDAKITHCCSVYEKIRENPDDEMEEDLWAEHKQETLEFQTDPYRNVFKGLKKMKIDDDDDE